MDCLGQTRFRDPVERVCDLLKLQIVLISAILIVLIISGFF